MPQGDPEERPARVGVRVRRPLAGQVRQEDQPFRAGRDVPRALGHQVVRVVADRPGDDAFRLEERVRAASAATAARRQDDAHGVPLAGHGMAERVDAQLRVGRGRVRVGEDDAAGADCAGHDAGLDDAAADRPRRLVPAPARHRRPHGKPCQRRRFGMNMARDLDAFRALGHERARDAPPPPTLPATTAGS